MREKWIEKVLMCVCMCVTERQRKTDRGDNYPKLINHF